MTAKFKSVQTSVTDYKETLFSLQKQALTINKSACELEEVITSIKTSTQTQDDKVEALSSFITESEEFIGEAKRIDGDVRDVINERKNDFYEEYEYLRPECEKKEEKKGPFGWLTDAKKTIGKYLKKAGEWCKAHWKDLLATTLIVIGAIAAIAAVICTGGTALVPLLTALFTAIGVSAGTAATVATVVSITIATITVLSTIGSSTLNIIGTWKDMSGNTTFKKWQTALNITCAVSNGIYSLGEIFNLLSTKIGGVAKSGSGVVDDVVESGSKYINQADRNKIDGWDYTPNDELYLKYKDVFDNPKYYNQETGAINWPENNGFIGTPIDEVLQPGTRIDRYGSDYGSFTSPEGIPYEMRAVAPGTYQRPYSVFEVIEPTNVKSGSIASWFDEPGGGIQYLLPDTVDELLDAGILRRIQ